MSIVQVLTDEQPIIEELTRRRRLPVEEVHKPVQAEREKIARLAVVAAQKEIAARELESRQAAVSVEMESERRRVEHRAAIEQARRRRAGGARTGGQHHQRWRRGGNRCSTASPVCERSLATRTRSKLAAAGTGQLGGERGPDDQDQVQVGQNWRHDADAADCFQRTFLSALLLARWSSSSCESTRDRPRALIRR